MTGDEAGVANVVEQVESADFRRRVNSLLGTLLEDETLSEDARSVLRHLQETPSDLVAMDVNELGTVLLEGLS